MIKDEPLESRAWLIDVRWICKGGASFMTGRLEMAKCSMLWGEYLFVCLRVHNMLCVVHILCSKFHIS